MLEFNTIQCEIGGYYSGVAVYGSLPRTSILCQAVEEEPPLLGAKDEGNMIFRNVRNCQSTWRNVSEDLNHHHHHHNRRHHQRCVRHSRLALSPVCPICCSADLC